MSQKNPLDPVVELTPDGRMRTEAKAKRAEAPAEKKPAKKQPAKKKAAKKK